MTSLSFVGAEGEQLMLLPLLGRQADAWHAYGSLRALLRKSKIIDEHAERAGRDPGKILRSTSLSLSRPWDDVRHKVEEASKAGFGYLLVSWPSEGRRHLETFVEKVMPELAAV